MKRVPFSKLTSFGNNFVIIDETERTVLTELEKSDFAYQATNINFGIGSDNFLVVQSCNPETIHEINEFRHYWEIPPDSESADFIFRMFEPNGEESYSCGNGLMSIAKYLFTHYGIESTRIMTEIPTKNPKVLTIGTATSNGSSWANLGHPRQIPTDMVDSIQLEPMDDVIGILNDIEIHFRMHDLVPFSKKHTEKLSGYLVFTGEPHMVIFSDSGFTIDELPKMIFIASDQSRSRNNNAENRVASGSWLVHHIGNYLNKQYADVFPTGINVNFAKLNKENNSIEYRCFERGIFRETLACGTGALAVSYVARRLNLLDSNPLVVLPHRSRWEYPDSKILVLEDESGWLLFGQPISLFKGAFNYHNPNQTEILGTKPFENQIEVGAMPKVTPTSSIIIHY